MISWFHEFEPRMGLWLTGRSLLGICLPLSLPLHHSCCLSLKNTYIRFKKKKSQGGDNTPSETLKGIQGPHSRIKMSDNTTDNHVLEYQPEGLN